VPVAGAPDYTYNLQTLDGKCLAADSSVTACNGGASLLTYNPDGSITASADSCLLTPDCVQTCTTVYDYCCDNEGCM